MISSLAAYGFKLFPRFGGFVLLEQGDGERELCSQNERGIQRQGCPELLDGYVITVLLQRFIALAEMGLYVVGL